MLDRADDDLTDRLVVAGGQRRDAQKVVAPLTATACSCQRIDDDGHGALDAAAHPHRVGAGVDGAQSLAHHRLGQHRRGGGAVTDHPVGLHRDFLDQLCAHVGERVAQLDLPRDRHAVVGDRGRSGQLLQDGIATLRAERHLDRVGQRVDALFEAQPRFGVVPQLLGHGSTFLSWVGSMSRGYSGDEDRASAHPARVEIVEGSAGSPPAGTWSCAA